MYLCEDGHPEIVHNNGYKSCPLCKALNKLVTLEEDAKDLQENLDEATDEIKYLTKELNKGEL